MAGILSTFYAKFLRGIRWNAFEAILYYSLLGIHQIALFNVIKREEYGLIGTVFALIYLVIAFTNFGFDCSMSPFFGYFTKSRKFFKRLFLFQFFPQVAIISILSIVIYTIQPSLVPHTKLFGQINCWYFVPLVALLTVSEATKKSLRVLLQLAFWNKRTSLLEVIDIIAFLSIVWIPYGLGYSINLKLVFSAMALTSLLSVAVLSYFVAKLYSTIPENSPEQDSPEQDLPPQIRGRIIKSRIFNYLNNTTSTVFSSNFLIPFFAIQFGLAQAGVFYIISNVVTFLSVILQKVFGFTGGAFLSNTKEMPSEDKRTAFSEITAWL